MSASGAHSKKRQGYLSIYLSLTKVMCYIYNGIPEKSQRENVKKSAFETLYEERKYQDF